MGAGRVEFANVVFAYRPGEPVLRGMSFVAEAGGRTALVGVSGGGKSTALSLMLRFYEPERGTISWTGWTSQRSRVARSAIRSLRRAGDVPVQLEHRDNISCGKADIGEDPIVQAAKASLSARFHRRASLRL